MSNQHRILMSYLLICCLVLSNNSEDPSDGQYNSLQCTTPKLRRGEIYSKCNISDPLKLNSSSQELTLLLQNVSFLDLSFNNLNTVPSKMFTLFKNLTILSLAQNNIKTIEPGTFEDLTNLSSLDLSFNDLREWRVNPNELSSLKKLDVTGNEHWLPSEQLLQLNKLTTVQGVTWAKPCMDCSLVKITTNAEVNSTSECSRYGRFSSPSGWRWHDQIQYGKALDFIKAGFWPKCFCDQACFIHQYQIRNYRATRDVTIKASFSLYATGSVALLVNITVVLVIVFNRSLRSNLPVCLILNVALCDALIGLFSLLYVIYNPSTMVFELLQENNYSGLRKLKKIRNIMGPILTCAAASQVFGSFILTLEKFLKIVFTMKPDVRIGKRSAVPFLLLCWSFSVAFAVLPVFEVGRMTYNAYYDITPLAVDQLITNSQGERNAPIGMAAGSQIALIIIQFISFVFYIPIFTVAKRAGASVGIKREATIARKIALLVFTNLVFFTIPVVVGIFQHKIWDEFARSMLNNWQYHALAAFQWFMFAFSDLPVLCVSVNSVLNPFLYALRHPKIKQQLDTVLSRCRTVSLCHTNAVQHGTDTETQETKL